jgi:hypothetical protein
MKDCPNCKLVNPDAALRCDCGYDFPSRSMQRSYLTVRDRKLKAGATGGLLSLLLLYYLLRAATSFPPGVLSAILVIAIVAFILVALITRRSSSTPD